MPPPRRGPPRDGILLRLLLPFNALLDEFVVVRQLEKPAHLVALVRREELVDALGAAVGGAVGAVISGTVGGAVGDAVDGNDDGDGKNSLNSSNPSNWTKSSNVLLSSFCRLLCL